MAICLTPQQSDFRGYPFEGPWVQTKTQQFQKNNCTGGQTGSWVSYSKTYTSYVSIDELMAQIEDDASNYNAAGQANANSNGTCSSTCQANSYTPSYGIFAMSSSQVWTNGISNTGVLQPYSKATFLSSADLSQSTTTNNSNIGNSFWKSEYPHTSSSTGYQPVILGNILYMRKRDFTTGNACTSPISYTVGVMKSNENNCWVEDFYVIGVDKAIILVGYNQSSGIKSFDMWIWSGGDNGSLIYVVERPKNYKYSASTGAIVYNGSSLFYMLSFHSKNNNKRTLTALFQTLISGNNYTTDKISNWSYSNQSVRTLCGGYAGSKVFFIYEEDGGVKTQEVVGTVSKAPNSMFEVGDWSYIRDPYSTNDCYFGNLVYSGPSSYNRLVKYNASTNAWTVINNN